MAIIHEYVDGLRKCLDELLQQEDKLSTVADIIFEAYNNDKQIFVMGNGGSASTASHCALGFEKQSAVEGNRRIKSKSLADNIGLITAWANDISYESVFAEQLKNQLVEGDVVIAISASGNSPNILRAVEYAKQKDARIIGLTGFGGGRLIQLADDYITFSSMDYGQVEDVHLTLTHILSMMLKEKIDHS